MTGSPSPARRPPASALSNGDLLAGLRAGLLDWCETAAAAGWSDADAAHRLRDATVATPGALYDAPRRPLVVGFFGGTGAGKSALLNRIAGREIARSSAERPTSTGVSAYVHASVGIERLPPDFPMARLHTVLHDEARWRDVLFLDMPDIDSVATEHRRIVERWLPFVDAVIYTVSPERYRDDRGWQLLLEHGRRHAWLFVMNHWDRGDPGQLEDLRALLAGAGFAEPELYRTVCKPGPTGRAPDDDFPALAARLEALADGQLVADLEARGVLERARQLLRTADEVDAALPATDAVRALPAAWRERWRETGAGIVGAGEAVAERITAAGSAPATASEGAGSPGERLVDEALRARFESASARFAQDEPALPHAVAARHLEPASRGLGDLARARVDAAVGAALAAPGTPLQRAVHRGCRVLAALLPAAAIGWAGWRAVSAFAAGGSNPAAYLGPNFAINAALLVGFAWGLPWLLARRTAPSTRLALRRGLTNGLQDAVEVAGERIGAGVDAAVAERTALQARLAGLKDGIGAPTGDGARALPEALRRLVMRDATPDARAPGEAGTLDAHMRSAGVRASVHSSTDAAPVS